jgi:secretion/DNA translocation related TadE-like protein
VRGRQGVRLAGEAGSVSMVAAGMMVVLMVLVVAAADVAKTLAAVGRAQTAADAAALAAAQEQIAPTGPGPQAIAGQYAGMNGGTLVLCTCPPEGTEAVVTVRVEVGRMLFLAGTDHVTASARAVVDFGGGHEPVGHMAGPPMTAQPLGRAGRAPMD